MDLEQSLASFLLVFVLAAEGDKNRQKEITEALVGAHCVETAHEWNRERERERERNENENEKRAHVARTRLSFAPLSAKLKPTLACCSSIGYLSFDHC